MKHTIVTMFLTLVSGSFALNLNRFLWSGIHSPLTAQDAQVVEIVRWRQPVCVVPAEGVKSCLDGLRKFQAEYERVSGKSVNEDKGERIEPINPKSSISYMAEEGNARLISPEVVVSTTLGDPESSEDFDGFSPELGTKTPELTEVPEGNIRVERSLGSGGVSSKPQRIYVTKVLDSPMTATLVAHNCLPDIGVPLCEDHQNNVEPAKPVPDSKPTLSISVNLEPTIDQETPENVCDSSFGGAVYVPMIEQPKPVLVISKPGVDHSVALQHIVEVDGRPVIPSDLPASSLSIYQTPFRNSNRSTGTEEPEVSKTNSTSIDRPIKNNVFQAIQSLVNRTENSVIVQTLQNLLHKSHGDGQKSNGSSTTQTSETSEPGILGNFFRPGSLFQHRKSTSTTSKPETVEGESVRVPMEIEKAPTTMDVLNNSGPLNILDSLRDNVRLESVAKPTEQPGLFGDLFANPVRPREPEKQEQDSITV